MRKNVKSCLWKQKVKGMLKAGYGSGPSIKKSSIKKKIEFHPIL